MSRARFAFAAHPDAIADLRQLPDAIRDQALLHLQDLIHGERVATRLEGRLEDCHKIYLGVADRLASHRLVVQFRDGPPTSSHAREVYLVAAGPRLDYAVYRSAQQRMGRTGLNPPGDPDTAQEARVQAARTRSARPAQPRGSAAATYTTASPGFVPATAACRKAR
ncbi:hypothetical protein LO771_23295 [Streptacidiphilus sp. ASG 303]|uniref:hypothetical protein n=1 Tax=Streptacidiphilus sp. ASG 303 TaxID=2896847 RepID=UPI001E52C830|nr:hypothetical protein [Streptacidiphilus sp. ASG 303]MCD0485229.1 hypothetical protein [Streptacidiphilus sp. ASG 303]